MPTSPYASDDALYPSESLYPSETLYPGDPTVADRFRESVGDGPRERLMWDAAITSVGMGLGSALGEWFTSPETRGP